MADQPPVRKPDNKKLRIDPFTWGWWLYLGITVLLIVLMTIFLKNKPRSVRLTFMFWYSVFQLAYLMVYKYSLRYYRYNFSMWNELPLYLCNLSSIISIIASGFDIHFLQSYCLTLGTAGALLAFLMPDGPNVNLPFFSLNTLGFYGYHAILLATCIGYFTTGLCVPEFREIPLILLTILGCLLLAHIVNTILRKTGILPTANYIFTYRADNPVLGASYKLLPHRFIYLLPLFIPGSVLVALMIGLFRLISR